MASTRSLEIFERSAAELIKPAMTFDEVPLRLDLSSDGDSRLQPPMAPFLLPSIQLAMELVLAR